MKPTQQIKLKIKNLVTEFFSGADKDHAYEQFDAICQETETKPFMVAGYIFLNAFSQDQGNWDKISSLMVDNLFLQDRRLSGEDFIESLNVVMANFTETVIDYPNAKIYIEQLFERMQTIEILTADRVKGYKLHIENIEKGELDTEIN